MTRTPSDYDSNDGWDPDAHIEQCPRFETAYSANGGYTGPVVGQDGRSTTGSMQPTRRTDRTFGPIAGIPSQHTNKQTTTAHSPNSPHNKNEKTPTRSQQQSAHHPRSYTPLSANPTRPTQPAPSTGSVPRTSRGCESGLARKPTRISTRMRTHLVRSSPRHTTRTRAKHNPTNIPFTQQCQ